MAPITPRRSSRIRHMQTPKMSERKKGLFQGHSEPSRESLTKHRHLPVVDSESDSEDCDLGIISTLDSSSGEENEQGTPKTPTKHFWPETRRQSKRLLKENQDLKSFIRSPFTLKKYQTHLSCPEAKCSGSMSTPATPHIHNHPGTPSSTHSCASAHTISSTSSRARKNLASLIADTESCSSSLKDLNFDTDSEKDSKENTPSSRSTREQNTPQTSTFKGVLVEQKINSSPQKTPVVYLTRINFNKDFNSLISPTQMLKTPHTTESNQSPPKLGHNRRVPIEVVESPDSACDSDKSHKRLRHDSITDTGPNSKNPRLDNTVPKARLSLFNSDRLKQMLSAKSFYGKSNLEINTNVATNISHAIVQTQNYHRRTFPHSHSQRRKRKPGQINMGVKHKIRKPKIHKNRTVSQKGSTASANNAITSASNASTLSSASTKDVSMTSQNLSQDLMLDKTDPFETEKQTIETLLSQWTEDVVSESEVSSTKPKTIVPCFNSAVIEETSAIFQPVTAIPVPVQSVPQDKEAVIVELDSGRTAVLPVPEASTDSSASDIVMVESEHEDTNGETTHTGQFLPVERGYLYVADDIMPAQEVVPDLDKINEELRMLDEQISSFLKSTRSDTDTDTDTSDDLPIDPVISDCPPILEDISENSYQIVDEPSPGTSTQSCEETLPVTVVQPPKLFPLFSNPNPGVSSGFSKETLPVTVVQPPKLFPIFSNPNPGVSSGFSKETLPVTVVQPPKLFPIFSNPNPGVSSGFSKETLPVTVVQPPKLFPIFVNPNPGVGSGFSKRIVDKPKKIIKTGVDQYIIDAGQKKFGATQCKECGVIFQIGDPEDEYEHRVHHHAIDVLKFNGFKRERVVGYSASGRCIKIRSGESGWKRVECLLSRVIHPYLGYCEKLSSAKRHTYTAYLYIEEKQIVGCLIVEPKTKAHKFIPGDPDCCSLEEYPVKCGVTRIWTRKKYRRIGVAKAMLDCARATMFHGSAITVQDMAFLAPTAAGKSLATKYCGTPNFYVYI